MELPGQFPGKKILGNLIIKFKWGKIRESQKANSITLGLEES